MAKFKKFKKGGKSSDYTTKDIFVERGMGLKSFTIPKGTYIGVGAIDKGFMDVLPENDRTRKFDAQDYLEQARAEGRDISWYKENEDKLNYGYKNPETFLKDTYGRYSMINDGTITKDQLLKYQTYKDDAGRTAITADAGEGSASMSFVPEFIVPPKPLKKIEPKKVKIKTEKTVRLKKATPYPNVYKVMSKPEAFGYKGGIQISSYIPNVGERKKVITREDYEKNVKPFYKRDTRATKSRFNVVRKEFKLP